MNGSSDREQVRDTHSFFCRSLELLGGDENVVGHSVVVPPATDVLMLGGLIAKMWESSC